MLAVERVCCQCGADFEIPTPIGLGYMDPDEKMNEMPVHESMYCDDCYQSTIDEFEGAYQKLTQGHTDAS